MFLVMKSATTTSSELPNTSVHFIERGVCSIPPDGTICPKCPPSSPGCVYLISACRLRVGTQQHNGLYVPCPLPLPLGLCRSEGHCAKKGKLRVKVNTCPPTTCPHEKKSHRGLDLHHFFSTACLTLLSSYLYKK